MNLEGYGPISAGMGGAAYGFHVGTAAMMNNPATLGFFADGYHLDLALGYLGPRIESTVTTPMGEMTAESESKSFWMPALGFYSKKSEWGYGIGVFGQGGMGTEYNSSSWLSDPSMGANTALEQGLVNRSEVSVGRLLIPVTYDIDEKLTVGITADFVWAGMDLQMALSSAQFENMANPMAQTIGTASGSMVNAFGMLYEPFGGSGISELYHAYFDFSNESSFTGEAKGYGFAGKVGATYEATPCITIGATYHSPTFLQDLETENATLAMAVNIDPAVLGMPAGPYMDMELPVTGTVTVEDFQWPWVIGGGVAWDASDRLMLALDLKYIGWESAMKDFKMSFQADDTAENGGFAGLELDATLYQEWENQLVMALGGAYKATDALTLRGGYNYGKNPVPDQYVNALFPAIVEHHVTVGAGYEWSEVNGVNASFQTALESSGTNPGDGNMIPPVETTHKQYNFQVMYSRSF
jgi:long-chain fatty acid transport protein